MQLEFYRMIVSCNLRKLAHVFKSKQDLCDKWAKVLENQAQVDLLDEQHGICMLDI